MKILISFLIGFSICWFFFTKADVINVVEKKGTYWCMPQNTEHATWKNDYFYFDQEPDKVFVYFFNNKTIHLLPCDA